MIERLWANILMGNNILSSKGFILNIKIGHAIIKSCRVTILVKARQKGQLLRRKLFTKDNKVMPPCSETMIPLLPVPLPDNQDYLFHSASQTNLILYTQNIHHETSKILVRNISNWLLYIFHWQKLDHIINICYNTCFLADADIAFYIAAFFPKAQPFFK